MNNMQVAKNRLLVREPFFGYLLLKLHFIEDERINPPTMCVDGRSLWYHPDFVRDNSIDDLIVVLVHELLHCVLEHPKRCYGHIVQPSGWAADFVVNDYIVTKTPFTLPASGLYDPQFHDMSYEEVYKILLDRFNQLPKPTIEEYDAAVAAFGNFIEGITDDDKKDGISDGDFWKSGITEAANLIKTTGRGVCEAAEELIESTKPAQLPWEHLLQRFLSRQLSYRNNWNYPNKRYAHTGLFLPSKTGKGIDRLIVAIDTSISVTTEEFEHIIAEINKILLKLKPQKLTVIHCDSRIAAVEEFTYRDYPFNTAMKGRGCTEFKPVFDYIEEEGINPTCLVYFSDLEGSFNFDEPRYPVMWINTNYSNSKLEAPFGENVGLIL
jgi:predicted metal-dependent peptidase